MVLGLESSYFAKKYVLPTSSSTSFPPSSKLFDLGSKLGRFIVHPEIEGKLRVAGCSVKSFEK